MEKMLEVDGDKRINAAQTLTHPYLAEVVNSFEVIQFKIVPNFSMLILLMNPQLLFMIKLLKTMT